MIDLLLISQGHNAWPLGCVDIANYIRGLGYSAEVRLIDSPWELQAMSCEPRHVGLSIDTIQAGTAPKVVSEIRHRWPRATVTVGGRHCQKDTINEPLFNSCDYIVVGEGEYAMADIVTGNEDRGVIYGNRLEPVDWQWMPLPDEATHRSVLGGTAHALFSRGCHYNCLFCCERRPQVLRRSPEQAAAHVAALVRWTGQSRVFIYDDIFTQDPSWLRDFAWQMERQDCGAQLEVFGHASHLDTPCVELLQRAGVVQVDLGAESGDDRVLRLLRKRGTVALYRNIHNLFRSFPRIKLHCLWMIGNAGDTQASIEATIRLSREVGTDGKPWFGYAVPYPGTDFHRQASQWGIIRDVPYDRWTNDEPVFIPQGLTEGALRGLIAKAREQQ